MTLALLLLTCLLSVPVHASASAGGFVGVGGAGGGSGGGHGVLGALPPWPFWLILAALGGLYWFAVSGVVRIKAAIARHALARLALTDPKWDSQRLESRAREAFFKVQAAWAKRDIERADTFVSGRLVEEYSDLLDDMRRLRRANVMKDLRLDESVVVGLRAGSSPDEDRVWVWMRGSLVDYIVNEDSGLLDEGNCQGPRYLRELWSFVRGAEGWVVDDIEQHAHPWKVVFQRCSTARARGAQPAHRADGPQALG